MQARVILVIYLFFTGAGITAQPVTGKIDSFRIYGDVKITIDRPAAYKKGKKAILIFYALPNGNTTAQTMGKKMQPGDDWHFDIQHISAQTAFIRQQDATNNYVVIYLENDFKSWPLWKQKHPDFTTLIPRLVDSLTGLFTGRRKWVYLNGHSGGGSFIFGYLSGMHKIPGQVKRISFLDSNYGYDSSYFPLLKQWLSTVKHSALNVFAYNDSIALYNGRPVVSPTGGTWYRSRLMLKHFGNHMSFTETTGDSITVYKSPDTRVQFFFKHNHDRGIYHTQQVELNGFIHSVFCGTKRDSKNYRYYGERAYNPFIK